jgi:hypothetical protein
VLDGEGTVTGVLNVSDNSLESDENKDTLLGYVDTALSTL